jgi:hypothetical protein
MERDVASRMVATVCEKTNGVNKGVNEPVNGRVNDGIDVRYGLNRKRWV